MELCIFENLDKGINISDGYNILYEGFQSEDWPTIDQLIHVSNIEIENITKAAQRYLEHDLIKKHHIRYAIDATLWNCKKLSQRPIAKDYF